ncbi:sn-glycerol-3-phosphate transport system permease protein ugpA [uncultured Ruminococcus sp.]|uniref:Sugar ABC transporter permease n=1 Tax=Massiliimalia timonensis TaxID=1987501 RepID=A0A8J6P6F8_9FIRM|nr:sugar ABC transporter permease [Massiliimalia timonensis]MBC8610199.1 sugar ABC transporter permease [Massiliimalia timonensis]SCH04808.1 sn-glycerol-3-phosphate transport system permease protein ugpA [uncultured Ruminococcus sp.]SCH74754.1 sn-glycerol-3-phosphate transport system permease protein ugpA [uncultured Clostridium sp.]
MEKQKGRGRFIFFCVAPATILFLIFMVIPTINIFRMSFYKWGGYSPNKEFVGFNNFVTLFQDTKFLQSFQNTVLLIVIVTIVTFGLALIFAALLTRAKVKGTNFFRTIFYIPNILSMVVIAAIFSAIYDPDRGLLNGILGIFRGDAQAIAWLGDQKIVIYSIAGTLIWQAIGYYMVMYMASMASIPESLYESANLEGVSAVKQFFTITIPLIWTNIRTTLTFFIISSINLSFLLVTTMTDGKPDGATEVFLSYMYKQAYGNSSYGYGMAIGVIVFLFSFLLSAVVNAVTKREPIEF